MQINYNETNFSDEVQKITANRGVDLVIVDQVFAFTEMKQAHQYMEQNKNIGKIIVKL